VADVKRRAPLHPTEGPPVPTTGRRNGARSRITGALGVAAVIALASFGAFVARAAGPLAAPTPAPGASTSARIASQFASVRAGVPGLVANSSGPVQFHHHRVAARKATTTTTTTVPVTTPPTTAPHVIAQVDVPPNTYPTSSTLCAEAVAQVSWPPGWPVSCEGSRSGLLGLTNREGTHIYMRSDLSESYYVVIAMHESGHAWDFARLSPADIATWCAARGCDAAHFFDGPGGPGWVEAGGAEDWAEVWRICHGGGDMRNYIGLGPPTAALCALQLQLVAS
jgi:hypothetical protein